MSERARRPSAAVSAAELEVLKRLWEGEGTVRELYERLREQGSDWAYTTVMTLLARLEEKGHARSVKRGRARHYRARQGRVPYLKAELKRLAEAVCDGAPGPLVQALVGQRLSADDIRELRAWLDLPSGAASGGR